MPKPCLILVPNIAVPPIALSGLFPFHHRIFYLTGAIAVRSTDELSIGVDLGVITNGAAASLGVCSINTHSSPPIVATCSLRFPRRTERPTSGQFSLTSRMLFRFSSSSSSSSYFCLLSSSSLLPSTCFIFIELAFFFFFFLPLRIRLWTSFNWCIVA